jgi:TP901 family phage tail tape measure protein
VATDSVNNVIVNFIGNPGGLIAASTAAAASMGRTGNAAAAASGKVSLLGKASLIAATGVMAFAAYGVGSYTKFNKAMTESTAIMEGETTAQVKSMERAAKTVATTTKFSAAEAAEGFYYMASAGMNAEQSIKALPIAAKFAQAGVVDLETGVEYLTDTMSIFHLKSKNATVNLRNMTRVSDVFTDATIRSQGTLDQFAQAMAKAGPVTRLTGYDIEEVTAGLAVFHDNGIKGARAGTYLTMAVRDLTSKANKNKAAFKKLNVEVYDSEGKMRPLAAIIRDVEKAMKGKTDQEKRSILTQLGLQDRSIQAILTLTGNSKAIAEYTKQLDKAGGKTEEVAEKQMQSLDNQLRKLKNTVEVASIAFGVALIPVLKTAIAVLGTLTRLFIALPDWVQSVIAGILIFKSALVLLNFALGTHLTIVGLASGGWHVFSWALAVATGRSVVMTGVLGGLRTALYACGTAAKSAGASLLALAAAHPVILGIAIGLAAVTAALYLLGKGDVVKGAQRVVRWFKSIIIHIRSASHFLRGYIHLMRGQFKKAAQEFAKGRNLQKKVGGLTLPRWRLC